MKRHGKKKGEIGVCTYCGKESEITREHVIARGFFPEGKPRPSTPELVNACRECNGIKAGDDSYMRDAINLDAICDGHPIAEANKRNQIARSGKKNHSELLKAFRRRALYVPRDKDTVSGPGYLLTIPIHQRRFNRWCEMVARGLYFAQAKERLPDDYEFEGNRIKEKSRRACFDDFVSRGAIPYRMGAENEASADVIGWTFLIDNKDRHTAMWLIWFYKRFLLAISCSPPGSLQRFRDQISERRSLNSARGT